MRSLSPQPESDRSRRKVVVPGSFCSEQQGGPRPQKARSAPAQAIISNDSAYVVDCGDDLARQLAIAGVALNTLRHIFITHHHSDHDAGYGNLIWLAWTAGLGTRVDAWGAPPLQRMTKLFFEMNAYDIKTRISNERRVPIAPLVHVHEIRHNGAVISDDNLRVTAALVDHPPVTPAFGLTIRWPRPIDRDLGRHCPFRQPRKARARRRRTRPLRHVSGGNR